MTTKDMSFTCVPFNMLPSELKPDTNEEMVEEEKRRIRTEILEKSNAEIVEADVGKEDGYKTMELLRELGSDLNINGFSLNFKLANGHWNTDIEEANYLMTRVVETLSVDQPEDDPTKIPIVLTSTEFSAELYGDCRANFVKRLGLDPCDLDLMVLRNVVMSAFPTDRGFVGELIDCFKSVVEREVAVGLYRQFQKPSMLIFDMLGVSKAQ